jgi:hypothetical protein
VVLPQAAGGERDPDGEAVVVDGQGEGHGRLPVQL